MSRGRRRTSIQQQIQQTPALPTKYEIALFKSEPWRLNKKRRKQVKSHVKRMERDKLFAEEQPRSSHMYYAQVQAFRVASPHLSTQDRAKGMRHLPTPSEARLEAALRAYNPGLEILSQYVVGPYIVDFFLPHANILIEVDGASHVINEAQRTKDSIRGNYLQSEGFTVLRFSNSEITFGIKSVIAQIAQAGNIPEFIPPYRDYRQCPAESRVMAGTTARQGGASPGYGERDSVARSQNPVLRENKTVNNVERAVQDKLGK